MTTMTKSHTVENGWCEACGDRVGHIFTDDAPPAYLATYERAYRKVRMSVVLMDYIAETLGQGQRADIRLDWGKPDWYGFYTPTLTVLSVPSEDDASTSPIDPEEGT